MVQEIALLKVKAHRLKTAPLVDNDERNGFDEERSIEQLMSKVSEGRRSSVTHMKGG
jgi:hypothetical protein